MQYTQLAELYAHLEKTSKRLEKTFLLAEFIKKCSQEDLRNIMYLLQGRVFAHADERKLGMSSQLLIKVISQATGENKETIENAWRHEGDLGFVAEKFIVKKKQKTLFGKALTVGKVIDNISKLAEMEGEGTVQRKVALIAELLSSASALEARYIVRTVAEDLRAGIGDSTLRDALVWTFYPRVIGIFFVCDSCKALIPNTGKCLICGEKIEQKFSEAIEKKIPKYAFVPKDEKEGRDIYNNYLEEVQHAFNVSNDFGTIAELLKEEGPAGLKHTLLTVGKPIKAMLYPKAKDIAEGFEVVGKPALLEPKLDGFRMQIHRNKDNIKLFTRNLEDVTKQFPDVLVAVKNHVRSKDFILDSEAVGIDPKTKRVVPFQQISQRIKRKYDIESTAKDVPVVVTIFDIIELNGETLLDLSFLERRKLLKAIVKDEKYVIEVIEQISCSDIDKAEKYYKECLVKGHEGIMMKSMEGTYTPGKRVGQGVKIKPVMESLDLVIVAAEWGEGKRANWLSSFTVACRDKDTLKDIGKVSTGLKEKSEEGVSFEELTQELKKSILQEKGRQVMVKPKIVVEVLFEEIQASPSYSSGYALRFPRIIRLRDDKGVQDISTLKEIEHFYREQK
ncbi:MAG: ATP-dependent DNA ligase [bacterium]|nr:ATP-dependent DNA ligase [bacterium]